MKLSIPYLYLLVFTLLACTSEQTEHDQSLDESSEAKAVAADFEESYFKWGYINKRGILTIEAVFDECKNFNNGLAVARKKDKWGYIDKSGRMAIPLQFQEAYDFSDSMAVVKNYGKKYEIINHKGEKVLNKTFDEIKNFTEGFAAAKDNNNWTYIDHNGKELIAPMFTNAYPFKNGLAKVKLAGKYGIIDTNMEFILKPEMDYIADLANLPILVKKDGIEWYINKQGASILKSKHEKAYPFKFGFAPFKEQGKMGIIDDANNIIIPASYTDIQIDHFPMGMLEVKGADSLVGELNTYREAFDKVFLFNSSYPADHIRFAANHMWRKPGASIEIEGVEFNLFPIYCIQDSWGAEIHPTFNKREGDQTRQVHNSLYPNNPIFRNR